MRIGIRSLALLAITILAAAAQPVSAGTASLAWDPVADTDLAGYRVYYGTSPTSYTQSVDVGNVLSTTISGLTDCTNYYFGVKAYDTAGNESTTYSNQVSGWSRPVVTSATPNVAEQGRTLSVVIAGNNFPAGAVAAFANAGITVNSTTVNTCGQLTLGITVGNAAPVGTTSMDVTDADGVFGTGAALFTVQAAAAPTVASTTPADGATGASIAVHPTVTFSEPVLATTITATNVKLLDNTGAAVPQAAGSPSLAGNTATITPAANLNQGETYKIQVVGGAGGVLDLANHGLAATFTQATGFSTVADTTAPTISAVASGAVGSTTANISWTTSEAADGQVFYRKLGAAAYQQTAIDPALSTSHLVGLAGLEPSTTIEYYVRSADGAGNAATSTPTKTFVTGASSFTYLRFEAESGTLVAPVRANPGASGAFGSSYIDTPAGTPTGSASSPAGTATFGIQIPTSGTWYVWVRVYGASATSDAWFESMNGGSRALIAPVATGQWEWVEARSYTLTTGLQTFELGGREAQARADRILVTDDAAFVPTEQAVGDQTPPNADTGFNATGTTAQVTLAWTNSSSPDFTQTVIRYRTDGKYPVSPVDGFPVVTKTGAPGSVDSFAHTGLTNGTTYYYSAFAIDSSGNVSARVTDSALVTDVTAPANVQNLRRGDKH